MRKTNAGELDEGRNGKKWASEHGKLPKFVDLTIAEMVGPKWWGALLHSRSLDISYFCIMPPLRLVLDLYLWCKTPSFSWWTPIFFMVKPPCFTLFSCLKTTIFQFTIPITTPFLPSSSNCHDLPYDPKKSTCSPGFFARPWTRSWVPPSWCCPPGRQGPSRGPGRRSWWEFIPGAMGISMEISWEYWWQVENGVILWTGYHWSVVGYQWYLLEH